MTTEIFKRYKLWFITGSQLLYGNETLKLVAEDAKKIVAALNESGLAVELEWKETLKSAEDVTTLIRAANADDECIGLATWMHTFSPAKMWIAGLQELNKPFCQLHTQFNRDIPWDSINMNFMNLNQTAHGGREFGFIGSRMRLERKVIVGHWSQPDVLEQLDVWMRAAVAHADSRTLKVVRFGDNMHEVAVTEGDKVEAQRVFGYSVNGWGLGDLAAVADAVSDAEIDALVTEYRDTYKVDAALLPGGSGKGPQRLRCGARQEIAIRRFLDSKGAKAFTTTFENLHGLDQLPGLACQRLTADGYGFGAEGDWKSAALLRTMKVMSAGRKGGTSFMEDYTYHFDPAGPLILGAHMLEICPSIACNAGGAGDLIRLEAHSLSIGGKDNPVRLIFDAMPGPALNLAVMDMGNRFRFVLNEVETIAPPRELPQLPVARAVWRPKPSLPVAVAAWIHAGGSHHTVYSSALLREHITDYAAMTGVELICIGEGTTVEDVRAGVAVE